MKQSMNTRVKEYMEDVETTKDEHSLGDRGNTLSPVNGGVLT